MKPRRPEPRRVGRPRVLHQRRPNDFLLWWEAQDNPSTEDFATEIGVSAATIWRYLNGALLPSVPVRKLIEEQTGGKVTVASWARRRAE